MPVFEPTDSVRECTSCGREMSLVGCGFGRTVRQRWVCTSCEDVREGAELAEQRRIESERNEHLEEKC